MSYDTQGRECIASLGSAVALSRTSRANWVGCRQLERCSAAPARWRATTLRHESMSGCCHPGNELWSLGRTPREFRDRLWCNCSQCGDDERNRSQRYKANLEKLASGDLVQVVAVVRDLAGREASRGLSAGESRICGQSASSRYKRADRARASGSLIPRAGSSRFSASTATHKAAKERERSGL